MASSSFKRNILALVVVAGITILAILAYFRETEISIGVKKAGTEATAHLKTQAAPDNAGTNVNQEMDQVKGDVTGVNARNAEPSNSIDVTQKLGTVEGNVTGVDLSKTTKKSP